MNLNRRVPLLIRGPAFQNHFSPYPCHVHILYPCPTTLMQSLELEIQGQFK